MRNRNWYPSNKAVIIIIFIINMGIIVIFKGILITILEKLSTPALPCLGREDGDIITASLLTSARQTASSPSLWEPHHPQVSLGCIVTVLITWQSVATALLQNEASQTALYFAYYLVHSKGNLRRWNCAKIYKSWIPIHSLPMTKVDGFHGWIMADSLHYGLIHLEICCCRTPSNCRTPSILNEPSSKLNSTVHTSKNKTTKPISVLYL